MSDLLREQVISLSKAAKLLPHIRNNKPLAPSTLWRWANVGLRGVRLETVKCGGSTVTSVEALERFHAAINSAPTPIVAPTIDHEAIERELAAHGV
jgi:hypothetical protein